MGCGESFEGVAVGADMYHQQNVKAFIGPYCNAEMDAVGFEPRSVPSMACVPLMALAHWHSTIKLPLPFSGQQDGSLLVYLLCFFS
jgi:hypothetical protein